MNSELERIWKEAITVQPKPGLLSRNLPGRTEESHENPSGQPAPRSSLELLKLPCPNLKAYKGNRGIALLIPKLGT